MKKKIKYLIIVLFLLLGINILCMNKVDAAVLTEEQLQNAYIIGTHVFTDSEDAPRLDLRTIMLATKTIQGDELDDMIIYFRQAGQTGWVDVANNCQSIEAPAGLTQDKYFTHINLAEIVYPINLRDTIVTQSQTFVGEYYNNSNYADTTLTETDIDTTKYYMNLGKYKGSENPTTLEIAGNEYKRDELKTISIGKNAHIEAPVWKIDDQGNILVAGPWLAVDSLPIGTTEIAVGGQTIQVVTYDNVADEEVKLHSVGVYGTVNGYTNKADITDAETNTIKYESGHGTHALGINLTDTAGNKITDESQIIFRKDANGNVGITKPELGYTYVCYPLGWSNGEYTKAKDVSRTYKLAMPGVGTIELNINSSQVVVLKNTIVTQSQTFVGEYYNNSNYADTTLTESDIDTTKYYMNLGKYTGSENPTTLEITGNEYKRDELKTISIGNNAFIEAPVWKIDDQGNILVAGPWLAVDSLPIGETEIAVGGQTVKVVTYESVEDEKVKLDSVGVYGTVNGYTNKAEITAETNTIKYTSGHGTHALGINLTDTAGNKITGDQIIYRKDAEGDIGITTPELGYSYVCYPLGWSETAFTEATPQETPIVKNYKLAMPGIGVIDIVINGYKVVN